MLITIDEHSGFCFGVTSAIVAAEKHLEEGQLFCLGDIVHNGQEVKRLENKGLVTIDYEELRELRGGRVLLRAHGEPPSTYRTAHDNQIEIIDATCPVVKKLQERIRHCYEHIVESGERAQILIFGKVGHAEVIGLQGQTSNTAIVLENKDDLKMVDFTHPIYLFSQTTMSVDKFHEIVSLIEERIDSGVRFEWHDTICRNVANRVGNIKAFAREQDLVIFVGGRKSSNAKVLYHHCCEANINTLFVESGQDTVLTEELRKRKSELSSPDFRVGICGATSTPLWLMQQVAEAVRSSE